jgi:ABC-2 type transport system ATP-binding protein
MDDSVCRDTFFAFAKAQRAILQMSMAKASLEEIFMELTNGDGAASTETDEAPAEIEAAEQTVETEESEVEEQ